MNVDLIKTKLRYTIFPGHVDSQSPFVDLHNRTFKYWKDFWSDVFRELGSQALQVDAFKRQSVITVITNEDEICGLHTYSFYNLGLDAHLEHSYMKSSYTDNFLKKVKAKNVMTMEHFTVDEKWRTKNIGVSLAHTLMGLGLEIAKFYNCEAVITSARVDIGAAKICASFGAKTIETKEMHNVPVDLMVWYRDTMRESDKPDVKNLIEHFWKNRESSAMQNLESLT